MRRPLFLLCGILILILILLTLWGFFPASPIRDPLPEDGSFLCLRGTVTGMDQDTLLLKNITYKDRKVSWYLRVDPDFTKDPEALVGRQVTLQGSFAAFSPATNPGEFDAFSYYTALGCGGRLREARLLEVSGKPSRLQAGILRQKREWKARLYRIYPEKEASILCGLLLGDRSETDREIQLLYRSGGIAHILAISSLHISILGMGLYRFLRRFLVPVQIAAPLSAAVLTAYGLMTGMSLSTCRAIFLFLLWMGAQMLGRTRDSVTSLTLVALGMLVLQPGTLTRSGFLLSFGCVYSILLLAPAVRSFLLPEVPRRPAGAESRKAGRRRKQKTLLIRLGEYVLSGCCVTLGTLPLQLYFFFEVSRFSVPVNLLVLPFLSILLVTGFFSMMLPGAGWLGSVTCLILRWYEVLCLESFRLPGHSWNPGQPQGVQIVLYYLLLGLLAALAWLGHFLREATALRRPSGPILRLRRRHPCVKHLEAPSFFLRLGFLCLLLTLPLLLSRLPFRGSTAVFLDVGQGDGIVITSSSGEVFLFDGGSTSRTGIGEKVLKPYLKYCGASHISGIFLSHPDRDHMNGLLELLESRGEWELTIDGLYLTEDAFSSGEESVKELLAAAADPALGKPVPVRKIQAGTAFQSGDTRFTCLHPDGSFQSADANEASECFLVSFPGGGSLLLTGDVTGAGEDAMRESLQELSREEGPWEAPLVLKAAHHGSRYSTPADFLEEIHPALTILSAGRGNSYGHPHVELLERLENAGSPFLCTQDRGAIFLSFRTKGLRIRTFCGSSE